MARISSLIPLYISRSSIGFVPLSDNFTQIVLAFLASKIDPLRNNISITLAAGPGLASYSAATLKLLFERCPRAAQSPLYENPDGTDFSRQLFIATICIALVDIGFDLSLHTGFSFRCGAASVAAMARVDVHEIQLPGRWLGDAYNLYHKPKRSHVIRLSYLLHRNTAI